MALGTQRRSQKRERLVARVTPGDKAVISRAAALKTIESRERIILNAEQSRRFVEALFAPPRPPTRRMLEAMRTYKATVKSDLG